MNKTALITLALVLLTACSNKTQPPAEHAPETVEASPAMDSTTVLPEQAAQAALQGDIDTITHALSRGFPVDARDAKGGTLLMYAAFNGHTELVEKLLNAEADVNAQDNTGSSALMFAASGPFKDTVQLLLDRGAEINMVDGNEHFTALMWAAAEGQTDNVKLLLKHNANPALEDIDGDTAQSFAARNGHMDIVEILTKVAGEG